MKVGWLLSLVVLLWVGRARAEDDAHELLIAAAGPEGAISMLEARTRELLRDYPVAIEWTVASAFRPRDVFAASPRPALARIWLDLRDPSHAVLYVVDDAHERFLVRVVPLEAGYDEVAGESLGTIIQSSVEALLAGLTVGVSRQDAEEQVSALETPEHAAPPSSAAPPLEKGPDPPPPPSPRARYLLALDVGYRAEMLHGGPEILHGPELGGSLIRPVRGISFAGTLGLGYRAPLGWDAEEVGVRLEGFGGRLGSGLRGAFGRAATLALFGTFGVDGLEVRPRATTGVTRSAFWIARPMLGLAAELELALSEILSACISAGAETDLMGHHFDVIEDGMPVTVLRPWPIEPVLRLGLRFRP